ncbi:MAG: hypothetical protein KJ799_13485 [Bacteroidetes bacterium]|nr:hypothetical protein [Bacteroidota bacterium]MBU1678968.1 hypothetical protein [Bacteroidota bacterium]MBU2507719.1 hypothetical protein [Bacteroidota bacterium]
MKTEDINNLIDLYFDGELKKEAEALLFTQLSINDESREYFKSMNLLKSEINDSVKEFPEELEARIFHSTFGQIKSEKRFFELPQFVPHLVLYTLTIILLTFSIIFYNRLNNYEETLQIKTQQVNQQSQLIELLLNSLPATEVKGNVENEIIIKANI